MAELDFILQAVTKANHAKALQAVFALPDPNEILVSVAFVKESGLETIEAAIKPIADRARFFIGIRNDITSIQAVKHLLEMKVKLYAVEVVVQFEGNHPAGAKAPHILWRLACPVICTSEIVSVARKVS